MIDSVEHEDQELSFKALQSGLLEIDKWMTVTVPIANLRMIKLYGQL